MKIAWLAADVTRDGRAYFGSRLFQYPIDVTPEILVDIYYGRQCQFANPDVRRPDLAYLGRIQIPAGWLRGHGAKGSQAGQKV